MPASSVASSRRVCLSLSCTVPEHAMLPFSSRKESSVCVLYYLLLELSLFLLPLWRTLYAVCSVAHVEGTMPVVCAHMTCLLPVWACCLYAFFYPLSILPHSYTWGGDVTLCLKTAAVLHLEEASGECIISPFVSMTCVVTCSSFMVTCVENSFMYKQEKMKGIPRGQ